MSRNSFGVAFVRFSIKNMWKCDLIFIRYISVFWQSELSWQQSEHWCSDSQTLLTLAAECSFPLLTYCTDRHASGTEDGETVALWIQDKISPYVWRGLQQRGKTGSGTRLLDQSFPKRGDRARCGWALPGLLKDITKSKLEDCGFLSICVNFETCCMWVYCQTSAKFTFSKCLKLAVSPFR